MRVPGTQYSQLIAGQYRRYAPLESFLEVRWAYLSEPVSIHE
jgi:hypothetical protein